MSAPGTVLTITSLLWVAGCAGQHPEAACPVAERGAWVVGWTGVDASGRPRLELAEICDEQLTDAGNESRCRERAEAYNRERAEQGDPAIYFAMWDEE